MHRHLRVQMEQKRRINEAACFILVPLRLASLDYHTPPYLCIKSSVRSVEWAIGSLSRD